jgi:hypothetical protein
VLGQLIEQDHIEQRLMHLDAAVVTDKAELAKAVHEEADAGSRGADHLRQGFLRNGRNEGFRFPGLPNSAINRRIRARRFSLELKS